MTTENHTEGDGNFRAETKYKQYSAAVERALKSFEVSTEWPDLISSLARLNKVLLAYTQYPVVPYQLGVCKRLSQCLHPNLPGGVHLKVLSVYKAIFSRIGTRGLASNLLVYSSGLFPLVGYASMSVRPTLLDICEQYYLPLGEELIPALHGLVLGLLPGLEDESEHTERICQLLDRLCAATDQSAFFCALWQCVLSSPGSRLQAINFILSKLNKKLTVEDQPHCLGGNLLMVISSLCVSFADRNVLVGRAALDVICVLFPFHQPFLLPSDTITLLSAALETLLKRDVSLNRRLYAWLLGSQVNKSHLAAHLPRSSVSEEFSYFQSYAKAYIVSALKQIVSQASMASKHASKAESILPYRLLRILMDRQEVGSHVVKEILFDLVSCLKQQVENLGGLDTKESSVLKNCAHNPEKDDLPRKPASKRGTLKADILQSANLFFNCLSSELLWEWMGGLLTLSFGGSEEGVEESRLPDSSEPLQSDGEKSPAVVSQHRPLTHNSAEQLVARGDTSKNSSASPPCSAILELVTFLLRSLPLDSVENAHQWHLPNLLLIVLRELVTHEPMLSLNALHISLELISFILQELLRSPSSQISSRASTPHSPSTPLSTSKMLGALHSASTMAPVSPVNFRPSIQTSDGAPQQVFEGGALQPTFHSPMVQPLEEMKAQILANYFALFSSFVSDRVHNSVGELQLHLEDCRRPVVERRVLSREVQITFNAACQLLLVVSQLAPETPFLDPGALSEPPTWLSGLMFTCLGSCDHHMTFVAMETLLQLLEMHCSNTARSIPGLKPHHSTLAPNLLQHVTSNAKFVKSVSQLLWDCLSPEYHTLHIEASTLLAWFHSLITPSSACETVLLEDLATLGLAAYHKFAVLWQYLPSTIHQTPIKPFNMALLRMLEGLQSKNTAITHFVQSWVKFATEKSELQPLLQPLVQILLEADGSRSRTSAAARRKKEEDASSAHAKYYHVPGVVEREREESLKDQFSEVALHYTQAFDARQVLYAFSLLQSILAVDTTTIVSSLGEVVMKASLNQVGNLAGVSTADVHSEGEVHTQRSLLELLLATCVDFLRSEYPDSLEMSLMDLLDNLQVKVSAAELLSTIVHEFVVILSSPFAQEEDEIRSKLRGVVSHPSYVAALVTLCDIQTIALLLSAHVVQRLRDVQSQDGATQEDGESPGVKCPTTTQTELWKHLYTENSAVPSPDDPTLALRSLFVHLLKLLQKLIELDAQCSLSLNPTTPISTIPQPNVSSVKQSSKLTSQLPRIQPSLTTAAQPFFQALLLNVLTDPTLASLHSTLLCMFTTILPNLLNQLDELAPKVLKQICKNLEMVIHSPKTIGVTTTSPENDKHITAPQLFGGELAVSYMESLVAIVLWCYFGDSQLACLSELTQHVPSMFWKANTITKLEHSGDPLSPMLKQPSTMSWLFGVFSTSNQKGMALNDVGAKTPQVGIGSKVGQYILMLLPAVYNVITEIWRHFCATAVTMATDGGHQKGVALWDLMHVPEMGSAIERKRKIEYEDIRRLIVWLLCPLAERESSAFFSSISHVWLEWNLESKVQASRRLSKRKESFIEMLHQTKVLPLERFIRCVQFTLNDIARQEDFESGMLRQKYLLHFLYKYISSTLQSSEELASCRSVLVLFLRDCFMLSYNLTNQHLFNNCHILCMLTSILHVFVCRVPAPEQKKQKKERKELQDVTHKLCEALSVTANVGLAQNYVVVGNKSSGSEEEETSDSTEGLVTSVQQNQVQNKTEYQTQSAVLSVERNTPPSHRTSTTGSPVTAPSEHNQVPSVSDGAPPSPAHHKNERSAASVRAAIGREEDNVGQSLGKQQFSCVVSNEMQLPAIQALAVLSNVLSHFIDCVFESSEKDKIHSLLKAVLCNVWPHLQNHSSESQQCYCHAVKLLSSLSEFQVTRKTWRKETFDLFLANNFFVMDTECLQEWKVIVDNLMTQDKVTFRDLLGRVGYSSAPGVINIFSSLEQEVSTGAKLLKRMSFAIFSGEKDQYVSYLPDIQQKLSEYLKFQRHPLICAKVFLSFRVLLLKFSPPHLMAFWPAIVAELVSKKLVLSCTFIVPRPSHCKMLAALGYLERDLAAELTNHTTLSREKLQLSLSACKLLDTAVTLPTEFLPHFQLLQWGFLPHNETISTFPVVTKICQHFSMLERTNSSGRQPPSPPYLHMQAISSLRELRPLFESLHTGQHSRTAAIHSNSKSDFSARDFSSRLTAVENTILEDFLEPF